MSAQVHIVLATYNGESYLREQLDSILAQSFSDWTLEICDDGSTDGTRTLARAYQRRDERIRIHENTKNLGYVKNFLEGIRRSEADYIMLCDQDDIWNPDKIAVTLDAMGQAEKQGSGPVLVFTDAMNFDSTSGIDQGLFYERSRLDVKRLDSGHLFMENKCIGCTTMLNAEILPYLEEMPEEIRVHDWWLALICSHFGKIVYVPQATMRYRQHAGNQIGGSSYGGYLKKRLLHIREQKQALKKTYRQGGAFCRVFEERMSEEQRVRANRFAGMEQAGWFTRRFRMFRYGFKKSGWIRNIGLLFLL